MTLDKELERYLNLPRDKDVNDPVRYWAEVRKSKAYPRLSRMALDYLTIPGGCLRR